MPRPFSSRPGRKRRRLGRCPRTAELCVLHGVGPEDLSVALASKARPVLNTPEQIARWKEAAPGRPCDVMVDTGMNRLGLRTEEIDLVQGLRAAHAAQPFGMRGRRQRDERRAARSFRGGGGGGAGEATGAGEQRRDLPRTRIFVRSRSPWAGALWRHPARRGCRPYRAGGFSRGGSDPAPNDQGRRNLRLWRDLDRECGHRSCDHQHRLRGRLSALLRGQRLGHAQVASPCRLSAGYRWT